MKRLDRVILGEVIGPWIFGVVMFTILVMAGSVLFQYTNYLTQGVSPLVIGELVLLQMPAIMALTFPMAILLACLLGFGRLSGDSEVTAMRACGTSLNRIMVPVALFGVVVTVLTFGFKEFVVPFASQRATALLDQVKNQIEGRSSQALAYPLVDKKDKSLDGMLVAQGFDLGSRLLEKVTILQYEGKGDRRVTSLLEADRLQFESAEEWKIVGEAKVTELATGMVATIDGGAWPANINRLDDVRPEDLNVATTKNFDDRTAAQLGRMIEVASVNPSVKPSQLRNMQYIYWNKFALPLAALIYALVGAPLGIRNHRTGAAAGFWVAILIIFSYFLLSNVLGIMANGGSIPPMVASFLPVALGLAAAAYAIKVKNS